MTNEQQPERLQRIAADYERFRALRKEVHDGLEVRMVPYGTLEEYKRVAWELVEQLTEFADLMELELDSLDGKLFNAERNGLIYIDTDTDQGD